MAKNSLKLCLASASTAVALLALPVRAMSQDPDPAPPMAPPATSEPTKYPTERCLVDCEAGDLCVDGACRHRCGSDQDCAGFTMCIRGVCREPSKENPPHVRRTCSDDTGCAEGFECRDGECERSSIPTFVGGDSLETRQGTSATPSSKPPSALIWLQPNVLVLDLLFTAVTGGSWQGAGLSGGANIFLSQNLALLVEGEFVLSQDGTSSNGCCTGVVTYSVNLGVHYRVPLNSHVAFFVSPKVSFGWASQGAQPCEDAVCAPDTLVGHNSSDIALGLDLGVEWTFGHFYLAVLFGGTAGVSWHNAGPFGVGATNYFDSAIASGHPNYVVSPNLNLMRLGASF